MKKHRALGSELVADAVLLGGVSASSLAASAAAYVVDDDQHTPDEMLTPNSLPSAEATSTSTAEYHVTALRVGVLPGGSTPTLLDLATATAGPVSIPPPTP